MIAMLLFRFLWRCSVFQIGNHGDKTICLFSWASTEDGKGILPVFLAWKGVQYQTDVSSTSVSFPFVLISCMKIELLFTQYQPTPNICFRYVLKPPNLRAAQIFHLVRFYLFILKITSSLRIKNKIAYFFLFLFLVMKWDVIRWLRT